VAICLANLAFSSWVESLFSLRLAPARPCQPGGGFPLCFLGLSFYSRSVFIIKFSFSLPPESVVSHSPHLPAGKPPIVGPRFDDPIKVDLLDLARHHCLGTASFLVAMLRLACLARSLELFSLRDADGSATVIPPFVRLMISRCKVIFSVFPSGRRPGSFFLRSEAWILLVPVPRQVWSVPRLNVSFRPATPPCGEVLSSWPGFFLSRRRSASGSWGFERLIARSSKAAAGNGPGS